MPVLVVPREDCVLLQSHPPGGGMLMKHKRNEEVGLLMWSLAISWNVSWEPIVT